MTDIVQLDSGAVQGVQLSDSSVIAYKGIPYAAPPVGDLRWRAPQSVEAWEGVLAADEFGNSPLLPPQQPYRLGIFGFLAHPELSAESGVDASGNPPGYPTTITVDGYAVPEDDITAYINGSQIDVPLLTGGVGGAFHTSDVAYFMNYFYDDATRPWDESDYAMGDLMSDYLVNFAKNSNSDGKGLPVWPVYSPGSIDILEIGDTTQVYSGLSPEKLAFWENYFDNQQGL